MLFSPDYHEFLGVSMDIKRIIAILLVLLLSISGFTHGGPLGTLVAQLETPAQGPTNTTTNTTPTPTPSPPINTTTPQTPNQTQGLPPDWWRISGDLVRYPEAFAGVCYPWLVTEHFLYHLPTGMRYDGVGGDTAVSVYCGDKYFVALGLGGVYAFRMDTGSMFKVVHLDRFRSFIGAYRDTVAVLDIVSSVVFVKNLMTQSDVAIKISAQPLLISYTVVGSIPIIAYSATPGELAKEFAYYLASPGLENPIKGYSGSGALIMYNDTLVIESRGIRILKITDPITLSVKEVDYIPLPFTITSIHRVVDSYLLAESFGVLVRINIDPNSRLYKTWEVLGAAVPTPVGYFVPSTNTSYVIVGDSVYPAPGYAVAMLSNLVFSNIKGNETGFFVLYPVARKSILILTTRLSGVLYVGGYAIAVDLMPGRYQMPMGAVIRVGADTVLLDSPEVVYPKPPEPQREVVIGSQPLTRSVILFPTIYIPTDVFSDVRYVATGGKRAVIIQGDRALIYTTYGVSAAIPGRWAWGGSGECVVLYDGASFSLYDSAGNPIASYGYFLATQPIYTTCKYEKGEYVVLLFYGDSTLKIGSKGVERIFTESPMIYDPTGLILMLTVTPHLTYSGITVPIQPSSLSSTNSYPRISSLWATWIVPELNALQILSIPDKAIFSLVFASSSQAESIYYPLDQNYILRYNGSAVEVIPYRSFVVFNCYIDVNTHPNATVYLNNVAVGTGSLRIYSECFKDVVLRAELKYHRPAQIVIPAAPQTKVNLFPQMIIASVQLNVRAPEGLSITSVVFSLQTEDTKETLEWRVGEVRQIQARIYNITTIEFKPVNACQQVNITNLNITENTRSIDIDCQLVKPVLAAFSGVATNLEVYTSEGRGFAAAPVPPRGTVYILMDFGNFTLVSRPLVPGFAAKVINVSIEFTRVYQVDVTPAQLGKIEVMATVPTAYIEVFDSKGNVVANGTGSLEASVLPGNYTVRASAPGYIQFIQEVTVTPGETTRVTASLIPLPPPPPPPRPPPWAAPEFQILSIVAAAAVAVLAFLLRRRRARKAAGEVAVS